MSCKFDTVIDRKGTMSLKYDFAKERGRKEDILPLWVADMDFMTCEPVLERLKKIVDHGIFGYSESGDAYFDAVCGWYKNHFGWETSREWIIKTPGVVFALAMAVRAFTEKGDAVLIQQPVYYPFSEVIRDNDRVLVNSPLKQVNGHYEIDFDAFEQAVRENSVKLFLLCSPHNPVGRVWETWELEKIGEICLKYGVKVVSDEIHSDFTWGGHVHHIFASLKPEFADITVTCTAPSKTFNLAGLQISNIFISNPEMRKKFKHEVTAAGYSQVGLMGLAACQAAYEGGGEWLTELKKYLEENICYTEKFIAEKLPQLRFTKPEGTYLVWIDFRALNLSEPELKELIEEKAGLWLDSGAMFGPDGEGFERINIACPRKTLETALLKLEAAVNGRTEKE